MGFAWSWACDDLWFLAQLFVDPARQGHGIGNALLEDDQRVARSPHSPLRDRRNRK
ncbi:GNAT family N-acetyltransferase [Mesorhizobium sp. M1C.F.Ca.ET.188.01.1.1]|uniref:GNAT family N-acetyltransferase n=1 Tax=Mesorhizobium sp. M1C.F.Ca.ET.188.01.1.1 TaxID=2563924 RepID=UPI001FE0C21E|nr:GNAT family N-acetyltransferase [Mesorhizobium sp. M1C.F.Ca.ET.188.01.1.1]